LVRGAITTRSLRTAVRALPWVLLALCAVATAHLTGRIGVPPEFAFRGGDQAFTPSPAWTDGELREQQGNGQSVSTYPAVNVSLAPNPPPQPNTPPRQEPPVASTSPTLLGPWPDISAAETVAYHQVGEKSEDPLAEAPLPPAGPIEELPVGDPTLADRVQLSLHNDLLTLTARDAPLASVLNLIAKQHGLNIVAGDEITQRVSVTLTDVRLDDALDTLLAVNGYTWSTQRNILVVTSLDGARKSGPMVQGRIVRVFPLNYVSAADVDRVVKGLISPVGQSFIVEAAPMDQRRTHEQIVVEDLPYYVARIEDYIRSVDYQPRQVLVEAHVLQVQLKDDLKHGVNFEEILRIANTNITFQTTGFANAAAPQAGFLKVNGTDLSAVIEALKTTTDAKTLASPKVAVLNGQEAKFQVGGQIGYLTTTTTETAAVQTVNFLATGVILHVTPIITVDRQVLMSVRPEVSTGRINPTTDLPESETTQVDTRVMLGDGEAVVIGGLIKEIDNEVQNKIPWLGDVKYVGRLFQRRTITRERSEVIIALRPRILEEVPGCREVNPCETQRAATPLFTGPLHRVDRSQWEPQFPDATCNPPRYPAPPVMEYGPACDPGAPCIQGPVPSPLPTGLDPIPFETETLSPATGSSAGAVGVHPAAYAPVRTGTVPALGQGPSPKPPQQQLMRLPALD
jgi:type IV pilus assembly protein PilQ